MRRQRSRAFVAAGQWPGGNTTAKADWIATGPAHPAPIWPSGYTPTQVERIAHAQSEANSLATRLAYHAGLRAHELLTLRPAGERAASNHRQWSAERFTGREGVRYTVVGKGGLVRQVVLSRELATALEARRLVEPRLVIDRGVRYSLHYDIGGGRTWSQSFSPATLHLQAAKAERRSASGGAQTERLLGFSIKSWRLLMARS
jgi:integrase